MFGIYFKKIEFVSKSMVNKKAYLNLKRVQFSTYNCIGYS